MRIRNWDWTVWTKKYIEYVVGCLSLYDRKAKCRHSTIRTRTLLGRLCLSVVRFHVAHWNRSLRLIIIIIIIYAVRTSIIHTSTWLLLFLLLLVNPVELWSFLLRYLLFITVFGPPFLLLLLFPPLLLPLILCPLPLLLLNVMLSLARSRVCHCLLFVCIVKCSMHDSYTQNATMFHPFETITIFLFLYHRTGMCTHFSLIIIFHKCFPMCVSKFVAVRISVDCVHCYGNIFTVNCRVYALRMQEERTSRKNLTYSYAHSHMYADAHCVEAADEESNASTFNLLVVFYFILFYLNAWRMWERGKKIASFETCKQRTNKLEIKWMH